MIRPITCQEILTSKHLMNSSSKWRIATAVRATRWARGVTGAAVTPKSSTKSYLSTQRWSKMQWKQAIGEFLAIFMRCPRAIQATYQTLKTPESTARRFEATMAVVCRLKKRMKNPRKHLQRGSVASFSIKWNPTIRMIQSSWD